MSPGGSRRAPRPLCRSICTAMPATCRRYRPWRPATVGTFDEVGTFSIFGNKTVTTGEGGMVITNNADLAMRLRQTKGQDQSLTRRYWHDILGFNYRMTNIAAAIGTARMERLPATLERKRAIAAHYRALFASSPVEFQQPIPNMTSSAQPGSS